VLSLLSSGHLSVYEVRILLNSILLLYYPSPEVKYYVHVFSDAERLGMSQINFTLRSLLLYKLRYYNLAILYYVNFLPAKTWLDHIKIPLRVE
jgi:hypothetical protein